MENLFIETDFGCVFAKSAGEIGAPLVLGIHGWSQRNGWHTWQPLMPPLAQAGFWVVSVDMPGWGQSVVRTAEPMTGERAITAVWGILNGLREWAETEGKNPPETAVLMGKSWGGGVALKFALKYPRQVTKLILTAPAFREFDRLPEITQPILLTWAEDDPVIPFTYAAKFAEALPNCRLIPYPTGGHSAAQNNVDDFAPKAIEFLCEN
ncbi:MAG: alpha/beta fold hydrolase [Chloroflexi bacterium]|nr:MAG: alpha/beta fold hydrolase [Chloroflexota bacterium]